jgi:hypothetical protein
MEQNKKELIITEVVEEVITKPKPKRKRNKNKKNKNKNKIVETKSEPKNETKQNENVYVCKYCSYFMEDNEEEHTYSRKEYVKHTKTDKHKTRFFWFQNKEKLYQKLNCVLNSNGKYKVSNLDDKKCLSNYVKSDKNFFKE